MPPLQLKTTNGRRNASPTTVFCFITVGEGSPLPQCSKHSKRGYTRFDFCGNEQSPPLACKIAESKRFITDYRRSTISALFSFDAPCDASLPLEVLTECIMYLGR